MNIVWTCDACGEPVKNRDGWVTINYEKIYEYEEGKRAWEGAHPGPFIELSEYKTHPELAQWHVWHRGCDPDVDSNDYYIDIERIRTQGQLLSWTSHLMEKNWFLFTSWGKIIRRTLTDRELAV